MKIRIIIALLLSAVCISAFAACSEKKSAEGFSESSVAIVYNGVTYKVNEKVDKLKAALGEPSGTISQYSCHYSENGDEYFYDYYFGSGTYNADDEIFTDVLRIHTVPMKPGVDYICDFECHTSAVTTDKGITVGSTLDAVKAAYGDGYVDGNDGYYTYYAGEVKPETPQLMFYIPDGTVEFFSATASTNF